MQDIADAADVSRAALYQYFGSKEEILRGAAGLLRARAARRDGRRRPPGSDRRRAGSAALVDRRVEPGPRTSRSAVRAVGGRRLAGLARACARARAARGQLPGFDRSDGHDSGGGRRARRRRRPPVHRRALCGGSLVNGARRGCRRGSGGASGGAVPGHCAGGAGRRGYRPG
ncbi:helix-turn-helix domain-containing protein [Aeromicrobium sp. UC242_57]|uniref:helix-turn-helix domain-containing protein n=1 Tax=Aeromicrobium sp. UC242_57 TaxID=3374624 RepID=UPI0037B7503F